MGVGIIPVGRTDAEVDAELDALPSRYLTQTDAATTYVPQLNDRIFIPAGAFGSRSGSANLSSVYNATGWYLDKTTDEIVGASLVLPPWWATFKVDGYFANITASSGDVRVGALVTYTAANAAVDSSAPSTNVTLTMGTTGVLKVVELLTGVSTSSGLASITVQRDADNAADTLDNDVAFLGLLLTRLTSA